jgi:hypothetical protein
VLQEATNRLRTADRHDRDAFGGKIATTTRGEGFERKPIADPFDEHNRTRGRRHVSLLRLHAAISPAQRLPTRNLQE